ncbi:MAG: cyclic nucleotide-binding domain-containing protein [Lentisphaerae bacterium]|nr:cyclic nucleotide-binding domain-containing protein [Lentisphaerota bacterium]
MSDPKLETKIFERGNNLFKEGEPATEAYIIKSGYVTVWHEDSDGTKTALGTRAEGEIVGEMGLIDDVPRSATVTAQDRVLVEVITRAQLETMLKDVPDALSTILHQLIESLRCCNDMLAMYVSQASTRLELNDLQ